MTPCRSLEEGRDTRRKSLIDDEQDHRFLAHSKGKGSVHGKVEESLDLVGRGVERRGWFREVLGPSPSGGRALEGSREETRMGARTSDQPKHYR